MSEEQLDGIWKVINDMEHRLATVENDIKWIKWLLGIELPAIIGLIIGVVKIVIG